MQHIEPTSVMPAVTGTLRATDGQGTGEEDSATVEHITKAGTGTLRATVGQATGEEDSATVEDITKDGVALNPEGRVTLIAMLRHKRAENSQKRK